MRIEEFDKAPIYRIANRIVDLYRKQLDIDGINASSTLSDNAKCYIDIKGSSFVVYLDLEHYWKYVEYGRGPGKRPPIDAIENWVRIKPVVPDSRNGRIPNSRQLAFMIARKIGNEGTTARHTINKTVYSDAMEEIINDIRNEIIRQLNQILLDEV
jgi:hypothetical protein